jgi:hypothetical protein
MEEVENLVIEMEASLEETRQNHSLQASSILMHFVIPSI